MTWNNMTIWQYDNNEKVDQRDLEEVLSFCIEKEHNDSDRWCINAQNDIVKDKIKECIKDKYDSWWT